MRDAIGILREAFLRQGEGEALNEPRRRIHYEGGLLHYMAAALPYNDSVGLKAYVSTPGGTRFVLLFFDGATGRLRSIMEADLLGRYRTGAASGLATDILARADAKIAGVLGAGKQAQTQIQGIAEVRSLDLIKIFSPQRKTREAIVERMSPALVSSVQAVDSAREAVEESDIIVTITNSRDPVLEADWVAEGAHINAAGSNSARRRELDADVFRRASLVVADSVEQAKIESGDLIHAVVHEALDWTDVRELSAIVRREVEGRTSDRDITIFESQGIGVEDVALARYVYEQAVRRNIGQEIDFGGTP